MTRITQARIEELRATVAHADIIDLTAEQHAEDLAAYVHRFAKPVDRDRPCLACGKPMGGFRWGLIHGQGHCVGCGWPAALYHFVKDPRGNEIRVVVLLQFHPDQVSAR